LPRLAVQVLGGRTPRAINRCRSDRNQNGKRRRARANVTTSGASALLFFCRDGTLSSDITLKYHGLGSSAPRSELGARCDAFSQLGLSDKVSPPFRPPVTPPHPIQSRPSRTCSHAATCSASRRPAPARPRPSRCRCSRCSKGPRARAHAAHADPRADARTRRPGRGKFRQIRQATTSSTSRSSSAASRSTSRTPS
jgi:hypothetical protein